MNRDTFGGAVHGLRKRGTSVVMTDHGSRGHGRAALAARIRKALNHQSRSGTSCASKQEV